MAEWDNANADNGINPTTGLPWGVQPDATSPTGYVLVATGQPVYKDGSAWNGQTSNTKPSGGTTIINTPIQQQAGRYVTNVDTTGAITGIPGAVYQQDTYDGSITIVSKPAPAAQNVNPADKNNDGLDDTTNMAIGVFRDPTNQSPTGYIYGDGQPVWPNGAPYTGDGGTGKAPTLVNGKYIWNGSKFVVAPGLETPASTNISVSGVKANYGSSSGGGGSAAAARDYAGEQAASDARQAQMAADARAWQAAQNDIDRQIRAQEFQANYGLNVAQFQAQQARDQAAQKSSDLRDFSNAISDTDMAKFQAVLYANGYNAGGTINNRLREDPNAFFSELANVRAAGLLDQIRNGYGSVAAPGIPATGGLGTTGGGAGTAGGAPSQPGATTGTLPSTQQNQGAGGGPTPPYITDATGTKVLNPAYVQEQAARREEENRQQAWATRTGWYPVSGPTGILYTEYVNGQPTGKTMTRDAYSAMQQQQAPIENPSAAMQIMDALQGAQAYAQRYAQVQGTPYVDPLAGKTTATGGGTTLYNMPWGWSLTNQMPVMPGLPYGDDNVQRAVGGANSAIQPRAVVAMAHGGGPVSGSLIVGDPQRPGVPNPELVTGDNIRVTPLNQMPPRVAGSLMMGMPKAATGTDPWAWMGMDWNQSDYVDAWGNPYDYSPTPTITPTPTWTPTPTATPRPPTRTPTPPVATTAGSGTTTSPVAPTTPSTVSTPSTGTSPTSSAPATGSLVTPTGQTVQQPTAGSLVTPTGQTVQQPTAPAPATGGLGSITDIVNGTATPTSQALLDEIAQWRQNVPLPNVDPLRLEFQRLDPLTQQSILQARQTRSYIPVAAQQYEINKYRIGGGRALAGSLAF